MLAASKPPASNDTSRLGVLVVTPNAVVICATLSADGAAAEPLTFPMKVLLAMLAMSPSVTFPAPIVTLGHVPDKSPPAVLLNVAIVPRPKLVRAVAAV